MTIRQVLLNGSGTSGDGTTWNDASDATSAYISAAGLVAAFNASAAGDIVYVKGSDLGHAVSMNMGSVSLAKVQNPPQVLGCKSATTNNQGAIVTSDLIAGKRTGGSTPAYLNADVPVVKQIGFSVDIFINIGYWYGIQLKAADVMTVGAINGLVVLEEVSIEIQSAGDTLTICNGTASKVITKNSFISGLNSGSIFNFSDGASYHHGSTLSLPSGGSFLGAGAFQGHHEFNACEFAGGATTIFNRKTSVGSVAILNNCKYPASWVLTAGTAVGAYRIESYGSDDTTGLTTGGSEQQMNIEDEHGTVVLETTVVHDSPADDGAAGGISWDMTTFANGTALSVAGLESPWMNIWVIGTGAAQTLTVKFCSDTGNTRATNWTDDEVWLEVQYPDDGGTSQYDNASTVANLLAAGGTVTDGTDAEWDAAAGVRAQELSASISPDYEGYVRCRVVFAPGANAETIYVNPLPTVA